MHRLRWLQFAKRGVLKFKDLKQTQHASLIAVDFRLLMMSLEIELYEPFLVLDIKINLIYLLYQFNRLDIEVIQLQILCLNF